MPSRHQNLIQDWLNRILPFAFHKLCIPQAPTFYGKSQPLFTFTSHFPTFYGESQPHKSLPDILREVTTFRIPQAPYADILREVLRAVNMPDILVRGLPPSSPWALLPDEPQDN